MRQPETTKPSTRIQALMTFESDELEIIRSYLADISDKIELVVLPKSLTSAEREVLGVFANTLQGEIDDKKRGA